MRSWIGVLILVAICLTLVGVGGTSYGPKTNGTTRYLPLQSTSVVQGGSPAPDTSGNCHIPAHIPCHILP